MGLARDLAEAEERLRSFPHVNIFAPANAPADEVARECAPIVNQLRDRGDQQPWQTVMLCLQALRVRYDDLQPLIADAELVATLPAGVPGVARPTHLVVYNMIRHAKQEIIVLGYELTDQSFVELLAEASTRGVDVVLICDRERDTASRVREMWPGTAPRARLFHDRERDDAAPYASMHAKSIVVDGEDLLITSANFTYHGFRGNIEVGVRIAGTAAAEARKIYSHLLKTRIVEECVTA